jgi:PD-(D/E)XK nuclease superfamily
LGYYDFLIIPKDITKNGIILEFKAPKSSSKANLVKEAKMALQQIKQLNYAMRLEHMGIKKIISIGIAFAKKDVQICFEKNF